MAIVFCGTSRLTDAAPRMHDLKLQGYRGVRCRVGVGLPAVAPKETGGSPEFPVYPCEHMPRSQTPVVSRSLAVARTGLLPSGHWKPSAFEPVAWLYPWSTTIHFSEFNDAACILALPLLRTLPFSSRSLVRLPTRWLAFGRVGLESASHPLGNVDMFQEVSPPFPCPEFISARGAGLFGLFIASLALHRRRRRRHFCK